MGGGSQRGRGNPSSIPVKQTKLNLTWFDHFKILLFHFHEPILLGIAMSCCMQVPTLSTLVYALIMFLGILPLVLSSNVTNIKFKRFLWILMLCLAVPLFIFKLVMVVKYSQDPTKFD